MIQENEQAQDIIKQVEEDEAKAMASNPDG